MQLAYNTKSIVTDKDGNPVSQYFNPTADQYEPVLGAGGGNRVLVYKADGTESSVSLLPILDKLGQLTGTVIDEETRKSNELQRIALYNQIFNMLQAGELKGDKGDIGLTGKGLEFNWLGTQLGVRIQGDLDYVYVELKGDKGDKGDTGEIENLNAQHIEGALGYTPADVELIGLLSDLTTTEKANLVAAINEVKSQSNETATDIIAHKAENVHLKEVHGLQIEKGVWTPVLSLGGTTGITYAKQYGNYRKIGDLIYFDIDIELTSKGVLNGGATITGLPFPSIALNAYSVGYLEMRNHNIGSGATGYLVEGISLLLRYNGATTYNSMNAAHIKDNTRINLSGVYKIA